MEKYVRTKDKVRVCCHCGENKGLITQSSIVNGVPGIYEVCVRCMTISSPELRQEHINDKNIDKPLLYKLIKIGKQMSKTPWCACAFHQGAAYAELNRSPYIEDYPQATYKETKAFHAQEELRKAVIA